MTEKVAISNREKEEKEGGGRVGEGVGQWLGREVQEERYSGI